MRNDLLKANSTITAVHEDNEGESRVPETKSVTLEKIEIEILLYTMEFENSHSSGPRFNHFIHHFKMQRAKIQYYLENFEDQKYLHCLSSISEPAEYILHKKGRAYLVENGFI